MSLSHFNKLYNYSGWANRRVRDAAAKLTPAQFVQSGSASFSSIRAMVVHTTNGQWVWFSRW